MAATDSWVKNTLTALRKLDRHEQRAHLEHVLHTVDATHHQALRREIETRRARVEAEVRTQQTRGLPDAARKVVQKQVMLARYRWLLHIMEQHGLHEEPEEGASD